LFGDEALGVEPKKLRTRELPRPNPTPEPIPDDTLWASMLPRLGLFVKGAGGIGGASGEIACVVFRAVDVEFRGIFYLSAKFLCLQFSVSTFETAQSSSTSL